MTKIKAHKYFLDQLPDLLMKGFGFSKYYTWAQVYNTVKDNSPKLLKYVIHAYALYCTEETFKSLMIILKSKEEFSQIRKLYGVPENNEQPFFTKRPEIPFFPNETINSYANCGV